MNLRPGLLAAILTLGACTTQTGGTGAGGEDVIDLPEAVIALAAPYQDLRTARLMPEDGCYWYRHAGPVELTMLPLRTAEGRPICTQPRTEPT